ncbi:loquacious isoform b [Anaeramoeba flamelloides]|uniref:Loquacious isoform b n=1 Tax=Anaeramoeba flamelloides TaxID=1746091 RepID=A0AAV7ZI17_9EUKA|nr:loquacious isoform b [Anaeramoeba flamelloides]
MIQQTQLESKTNTKIEQPFSLQVVVLIDNKIVFKQILICNYSSQTFSEILNIINKRWDPRPTMYDSIELNTITNKDFFQYSLNDPIVSCCGFKDTLVVCNKKEYINYLNNEAPNVLLQLSEKKKESISNLEIKSILDPKSKKKSSNEPPKFVSGIIEELYLGHISDISNEREYYSKSLTNSATTINGKIIEDPIINYFFFDYLTNPKKKMDKKEKINNMIEGQSCDILHEFAMRVGSKLPSYKIKPINPKIPNSAFVATSIFVINNKKIKKTGIGNSKKLAKSNAAYNICLELVNLKIIDSLVSLFNEKDIKRNDLIQSPKVDNNNKKNNNNINIQNNKNKNKNYDNHNQTKNVKKDNIITTYDKKTWKDRKTPFQILLELAQKENWIPININYTKKNQHFVCKLEISKIENHQHSISIEQTSKALAKHDAALKMLNKLGFYFRL